jgi:hypothetical protein
LRGKFSAIYVYRNLYSYHAFKNGYIATTSGTDMVMLLNDVIRIDAGDLDFGGPLTALL